MHQYDGTNNCPQLKISKEVFPSLTVMSDKVDHKDPCQWWLLTIVFRMIGVKTPNQWSHSTAL